MDQNVSDTQVNVYVIVALTICLLLVIANRRIFSKAGEAGWKSIVPIYASYILFKIMYGNGWKFLFLLVPILDVIIMILQPFRLSKAFGKGGGFGLGMLFFPNIFTLILGFGSAEYSGPTDSFI